MNIEILPHDREDYCIKITAATAGGECPTWRRVLNEWTGFDNAFQAYLQRCAGYWLTGFTTEQTMWFFFGPEATGKSMFIGTIAGAMGDYAQTAPMDLLTIAQGERHPTELAGLRGSRLVVLAETEEGRRWAESRIKTLTGGDRITARFMRADFFEYTPAFKIVVHGNHRPHLRNPDGAMRRRFHVIPFTNVVPEEKRDLHLAQKLKAEWGGILAWAIEGNIDWAQQGLNPPPIVTGATEEYFAAEDALGRWLSEECVQGPNFTGRAGKLYEAWKVWCEKTGEFCGSGRRFWDALEEKGFVKDRNREGAFYIGIGLKQRDV